jgi:hypothetical protein
MGCAFFRGVSRANEYGGSWNVLVAVPGLSDVILEYASGQQDIRFLMLQSWRCDNMIAVVTWAATKFDLKDGSLSMDEKFSLTQEAGRTLVLVAKQKHLRAQTVVGDEVVGDVDVVVCGANHITANLEWIARHYIVPLSYVHNALVEACRANQIDTVRWLLTEYKLDARDVYKNGKKSAYHTTWKHNDRILSTYLATHYAYPQSLIDAAHADTENLADSLMLGLRTI